MIHYTSIVEVASNPGDPWAWAGLVGDVIDVAVPCVGGIGEVIKTCKETDNVIDVIDAAKSTYKAAKTTSPIKKATGSYEIIYKSGKNYVGKGGFNRAITSAKRYTKNDVVESIRWKSAPNTRKAFIDEYQMQKWRGVLSGNKYNQTYNKIWSPGRRYSIMDASFTKRKPR